MCLTTKIPEIKTAEQDIRCYKSGIHWGKGKNMVFYSNYNSHEYRLDVLQPKVELTPVEKPYFTGIYTVDPGYHTDTQKDRWVNVPQLFIIPKGSKYIEGWNNDQKNRKNYVSETLVWLGPANAATERRLKWKAIKNQLKKLIGL